MSIYVELQVTSHSSFRRGASSPEHLFATAALQGHRALGIADLGSSTGRHPQEASIGATSEGSTAVIRGIRRGAMNRRPRRHDGVRAGSARRPGEIGAVKNASY